jgi:CBS domain-containing protein
VHVVEGMSLHARDVMQTDLITVSPDTPLLQVHRLFIEEEINGAPVIDEDDALVGVISSLDLLRAVQEEYDNGAVQTEPVSFWKDLPYAGPDWVRAPENFQDRMSELSASDAMVTEVVSVRPDAAIAEVARIMRRQRIHRVLVVDGRELQGIVTTFDLVGLLE